MTTRFILTAFIIAMLCSLLPATIINIPDDYTIIQEGIDASSDGDTVLVQPGIYVENINFNGHSTVLASQFLLTEDTSFISTTIIDGHSENSVIYFDNYLDSTAAVIGFTIQNGHNEDGGGIYCLNSSPSILNNKIQDNIDDARGGGIYCEGSSPYIYGNNISGNNGSGIFCYNYSSPIIDGNVFYNNSGGGVRCSFNSYPDIIDNIISNNSSRYMGGGIYCERSNPLILNNIITDNFAQQGGGGIYCGYSNPQISHNIIANNSTQLNGGGIRCDEGSDASIRYNLISRNWAGSDRLGGGIYCYQSSPEISNNTICANFGGVNGGGIYAGIGDRPAILNTILYSNTIGNNLPSQVYSAEELLFINYCNIEGGWEWGYGNIDADPLFVDPENGDFHLQAGSPCIDSGDPNSPLDPDSTRADIGAFFFEHTVGVDNELTELPSGFALLQNYPNPFNPSTTIEYSLDKPTQVNLVIYNLLGQQVALLFNDIKSTGNYAITWDASGYPSGVYFAKLISGERNETIKMVLMK